MNVSVENVKSSKKTAAKPLDDFLDIIATAMDQKPKKQDKTKDKLFMDEENDILSKILKSKPHETNESTNFKTGNKNNQTHEAQQQKLQEMYKRQEIEFNKQKIADEENTKYGIINFDKLYNIDKTFDKQKKITKKLLNQEHYKIVSKDKKETFITMYCGKNAWTYFDEEVIDDVDKYIDENNIQQSNSPSWYFHRQTGYVYSLGSVLLHRYLLRLSYQRQNKVWNLKENNMSVDHINRNKLDNRLSNLRATCQSIQNSNREKKNRNCTAQELPEGIQQKDIPIKCEWRTEKYKTNGKEKVRRFFTIDGHPMLILLANKCDKITSTLWSSVKCTIDINGKTTYSPIAQHKQLIMQYNVLEEMQKEYNKEPNKSKIDFAKYNVMYKKIDITDVILGEKLLGENSGQFKKWNTDTDINTDTNIDIDADVDSSVDHDNKTKIQSIIDANVQNNRNFQQQNDNVDKNDKKIQLYQCMQHRHKGEVGNGGAICIANHVAQNSLSRHCKNIKKEINSSLSAKYSTHDKYQQMVLQEKVLSAIYNEYKTDIATGSINYDKYNNMYRTIDIYETCSDPTKIPGADKLTYAKDMNEHKAKDIDEPKKKNISKYIAYNKPAAKDRGAYFYVKNHPSQLIFRIKEIRSPGSVTMTNDAKLKNIEQHVTILDKIWVEYLTDRESNILCFDTEKYQKMYEDNKPEKEKATRLGNPRKSRKINNVVENEDD